MDNPDEILRKVCGLGPPKEIHTFGLVKSHGDEGVSVWGIQIEGDESCPSHLRIHPNDDGTVTFSISRTTGPAEPDELEQADPV